MAHLAMAIDVVRPILRSLVAAVLFYCWKCSAVPETFMPGVGPLKADPFGYSITVNPQIMDGLQQAVRSSMPWMKPSAAGSNPLRASIRGRRSGAGETWAPLPIYPPILPTPEMGRTNTIKPFHKSDNGHLQLTPTR